LKDWLALLGIVHVEVRCFLGGLGERVVNSINDLGTEVVDAVIIG
jgi:hypothetical protein